MRHRERPGARSALQGAHEAPLGTSTLPKPLSKSPVLMTLSTFHQESVRHNDGFAAEGHLAAESV